MLSVHINSLNITLLGLASPESNSSSPNIRFIYVFSGINKSFDIVSEDRILIIRLDERFNTISYTDENSKKGNTFIKDFLFDAYYKLRDSDPCYGNDGNGYLYENTKHLFLIDFFNYLKQINRENIIDNINE
jgi:hypothetical protein